MKPSVDPAASHVLHREFDRHYPVMVKGDGSWLEDRTGKRYLDAVGGGAGVTIVGQAHPRIVQVASEQLARLAYVHNQKYTNEQQERLAERICAHAPSGIDRAFFVQGGAEANEAALRMIRKYHVDNADPKRTVIMTQSAAYHGSTLGTLSLSGRSVLKHPFEPWIPKNIYFPPFHGWRNPYPGDAAEVDWYDVLDQTAAEVGSDHVAAVMFEPIPASAAPALVPPPSFLPAARGWCTDNGALLVLDEVVTGVGRTGKWFAADHWDLVPDIITIAKGLGGGYTPIGALLVHERVYAAVEAASREFEHGHTLNGNPVSCAVANSLLDILEDENLVERSAIVGQQIRHELAVSLSDVEMVGEIRGLGTLIGIEYAKDRASKDFLTPDLNVHRRIELAALDEGLLIYGTQNTSEGYIGDATLLAPAYNVTDQEVRMLVERMARAVQAVADEVWTGRYTGLEVSRGQSPNRVPAPRP